MKKFFNITANKYLFDLNDVRALGSILNVLAIIKFGLIASWLGLMINTVELIHDLFSTDRRINFCLLHLSLIVLNVYFLNLLRG